jgi:hypothetical protein
MPSSSNLENLAKIGQLKAEPPAQSEIDGLVASGRKRLKDAKNPANALESRFDLAYSAAHAFSLAALRGAVIARKTATSCSRFSRTRSA